VNYENHEEALMAVEKLHDIDLKGMKLFVSRAQKKAECEVELRRSFEHTRMEKLSKYEGVNVYIKNLEDDVDDETLHADFEPFGAVTSCRVMRSGDGTSKGLDFVCFASPAEATAAITEMNNKLVRTKPLYVALVQPRDVRRQQLESQIGLLSAIRSGCSRQ
jgi:polyadenylate-binding protein